MSVVTKWGWIGTAAKLDQPLSIVVEVLGQLRCNRMRGSQVGFTALRFSPYCSPSYFSNDGSFTGTSFQCDVWYSIIKFLLLLQLPILLVAISPSFHGSLVPFDMTAFTVALSERKRQHAQPGTWLAFANYRQVTFSLNACYLLDSLQRRTSFCWWDAALKNVTSGIKWLQPARKLKALLFAHG